MHSIHVSLLQRYALATDNSCFKLRFLCTDCRQMSSCESTEANLHLTLCANGLPLMIRLVNCNAACGCLLFPAWFSWCAPVCSVCRFGLSILSLPLCVLCPCLSLACPHYLWLSKWMPLCVSVFLMCRAPLVYHESAHISQPTCHVCLCSFSPFITS